MGWHVSRYNLFAPIPGTKNVAIANLFKGTCGVYSPLDLFLLGELETLDAEHPILGRFRERGLIVNFDEREALEAIGRMGCTVGGVGLLCASDASDIGILHDAKRFAVGRGLYCGALGSEKPNCHCGLPGQPT